MDPAVQTESEWDLFYSDAERVRIAQTLDAVMAPEFDYGSLGNRDTAIAYTYNLIANRAWLLFRRVTSCELDRRQNRSSSAAERRHNLRRTAVSLKRQVAGFCAALEAANNGTELTLSLHNAESTEGKDVLAVAELRRAEAVLDALSAHFKRAERASMGERGAPKNEELHEFFDDLVLKAEWLSEGEISYSNSREPSGRFVEFFLACIEPIRPTTPKAIANMMDRLRPHRERSRAWRKTILKNKEP